MDWLTILIIVIQCFIITLAVTTAFAYLTLFERRILARLQNRVGPNRAGPAGFLQPAADAVKLFFKEDIVPAMADKPVYLLAPALAVIPALIIWAVIPFGCLNLNWDYQACYDPARTNLWNILQITDLNIGVLYVLAVTSIGVYGITLAGWASNNKYSMLGGIRSSAQLISYELALGCAVLSVVMTYGTFSTHEIVAQQQGWLWGIIPQLLGFVLYMVAATAEVVRAPFDLVEAEQELTGGYNTEYGSMKFALFFMAEYIKLIAVSALAVTFFFGGWHFPGLDILGRGVTALGRAGGGQHRVWDRLARCFPAQSGHLPVHLGLDTCVLAAPALRPLDGFGLEVAPTGWFAQSGLHCCGYCADPGSRCPFVGTVWVRCIDNCHRHWLQSDTQAG